MKRVALYARYSSDSQRDASIADQLRDCRRLAEREGWKVVEEYTDHAVSGATLLRRGIQSLMHDAAKRKFNLVVAESLDRFSRDQEDTARMYKQLKFVDVHIVTKQEGEVSELHVGFKGTMNALYLRDLADKTHRGLLGRVEDGKSGGGLCYGYRTTPGQTGDFEIVPDEKRIVIRIFKRFAAGVSAKAIAMELNREGVRGPRASAWSPSTIHGTFGRGTGILNNDLYVGVRVWNRLRYLKDPSTGKRVSRLNPPEEWTRHAVPHLRIVDDELWQAVKTRQEKTRAIIGERGPITRARRPSYLFSGLTKCSVCGGGFIVQSRDALRCFNRVGRGTCSNDRVITRMEVEARLERAMTARMFDKAVFADFCKDFVERWNERARVLRSKADSFPREIADCERRQKQILEYMLKGFEADSFKGEVLALEARIKELKVEEKAATKVEPPPALHPRMADEFRRRTSVLFAALKSRSEQEREASREALRGFIDHILIPPGDESLQVVGKLGEMLSAATGWDGATIMAVVTGSCGGTQRTVTTDLHNVAA